MKKQILTLIIGILIGAIITTAVFLILKGNAGKPDSRFNRGDMPSMNGDFPSGGKGFSKPNENLNEQVNSDTNNIEE